MSAKHDRKRHGKNARATRERLQECARDAISAKISDDAELAAAIDNAERWTASNCRPCVGGGNVSPRRLRPHACSRPCQRRIGPCGLRPSTPGCGLASCKRSRGIA
jgi:hypothetical protein